MELIIPQHASTYALTHGVLYGIMHVSTQAREGDVVTKAAGQPEEIVKTRLRKFLPNHFLFAEEIKGKGLFQNVVADFWCFPKQELIDAGWQREPFVIEVKGYDLEDQRKRTAIHVVHQAIVYAYSKFPTKQGYRRPSWVLIHPPLSAFLESDGIDKFQTFEGGLAYGLTRVAALFQVGEFAIIGDGYEVRFHGGTYYSSKRGFNGSNKLARGRDVASR